MLVNDILTLCTTLKQSVTFVRVQNRKISAAIDTLKFEIDVLENTIQKIMDKTPDAVLSDSISVISKRMAATVARLDKCNDRWMKQSNRVKCLRLVDTVMGSGLYRIISYLESLETDLRIIVDILSLELSRMTFSALERPEATLRNAMPNANARNFWIDRFGLNLHIDKAIFAVVMDTFILSRTKASTLIKEQIVTNLASQTEYVSAFAFSGFVGDAENISDVFERYVSEITKHYTLAGFDSEIIAIAKSLKFNLFCIASATGKVMKLHSNHRTYDVDVFLIPEVMSMQIDEKYGLLVMLSGKNVITILNLFTMMKLNSYVMPFDAVLDIGVRDGSFVCLHRFGGRCIFTYSVFDPIKKAYEKQYENTCTYNSFKCNFVSVSGLLYIAVKNFSYDVLYSVTLDNVAIASPQIPAFSTKKRRSEAFESYFKYLIHEDVEYNCSHGKIVSSPLEHRLVDKEVEPETVFEVAPDVSEIVSFDVLSKGLVVLISTESQQSFDVVFAHRVSLENRLLMKIDFGRFPCPSGIHAIENVDEDTFVVMMTWTSGDITLQRLSFAGGKVESESYHRIPSLNMLSMSIHDHLPENIIRNISTSPIVRDLLFTCKGSMSKSSYWAAILATGGNMVAVNQIDLAISCHTSSNDSSYWYVGVVNRHDNCMLNILDRDGHISFSSDDFPGIATELLISGDGHVLLQVTQNSATVVRVFSASHGSIYPLYVLNQSEMICTSEFHKRVVLRDASTDQVRITSIDDTSRFAILENSVSRHAIGAFVASDKFVLIDAELLYLCRCDDARLIFRFVLSEVPRSICTHLSMDRAELAITTAAGIALMRICNAGKELENKATFLTHVGGKVTLNKCRGEDILVASGDRGGIVWFSARDCLPSNELGAADLFTGRTAPKWR